MHTSFTFLSAASLSAFAFVLGAGCGSSSSDTAPVDAGPDGAHARPDAAVDASSQTWCALQPTHDFCADFDGVDPMAGWTNVDDDNGDTVGIAPSDRSPPNALSISGPGDPSNAGTFLGGSLTENIIKVAPKTIKFAFDARVDASTVLDDAQGISLLNVEPQSMLAANDWEAIATLTLKKSGAVLLLSNAESFDAGISPPTPVPLSQPFPIGAWTHVELDCISGAAGISVTLTLDGATVAQGTLRSDAFTTGNVDFEVSALRGAGGPSGAFLGTFDNVTIDFL